MNHVSLPDLYKALTLCERAALASGDASAEHFNPELAHRRRQRWKAQPPFGNSVLFTARLAQDGLSDESFSRLLGNACQAYQSSAAPDWASQLLRAFSEDGLGRLRDRPAAGRVEDHEQPAPDGFLAAIAPLIRAGRERVRLGLAELQATSPRMLLADPSAVEEMLFATVRRPLERMLSKTLALELNVARLQGTMHGATPQERFASFVEQLRQRAGVSALVNEYPVLFRLAAARIDAWADASLELVARLDADWEALAATFDFGPEPAGLAGIERVRRNTQRGGRSVAILTFSSGAKVVYKPRSLAVERHFQELLDWLNRSGHRPPFRLLKVLDCGAYGWVECLAAAACESPQEVERFYRRQGAYLALLYALEATDIHLDNLIAAGEQPMLIDLEALFHPRDAEPDLPELEQVLDRATYHSVLRTGLLPEPELGDEGSAGFDLSGLAGAGGQRTPYLVPVWENRSTDVMRLVRKPVRIAGGQNLPTLIGRPANVVDYRYAVEEGFVSLYRLLTRRLDEFLAPQGPLARFCQDEIRVLPRSGSQYGAVLDHSYHPDLLRDALERDLFMDRLWQGVEREPSLARLIPHEKADLLAGDIPHFTTLADSSHAYSSKGQLIRNFFPISGLEAARRRLSALSEDDLARQRWYIQAALATVAKGPNTATTRVDSAPAEPPDRQQLLDMACAIGARLDRLALRAGGEASWLGVALIEDRHWEIGPTDLDLYNGLPGVALFLAHLGSITGQERWTNLAEAAVATLLRYIAEEMEAKAGAFSAVGALDGLGGLLYTLAHLAALWPRPDLLQIAARLVVFAGEKPGLVADHSVARGVAGCLIGLLSLHQIAPSQQTLAMASRWGDELLRAIPWAHSREAIKTGPASGPFGILWHGEPGIAWPLLALARISGEARFHLAAYGINDRNLATNRQARGIRAAEARRHAAGIALGCLSVLPYIDRGERRSRLFARVEAALRSTLDYNFGRNHSLGHGDLGCLDLLLQSRAVLDEARWSTRWAVYTARLVASLEQHGWVTGIPLGVESPGLMTGLAGIGYGLLRLAEPQRVPSILAFEMLPG